MRRIFLITPRTETPLEAAYALACAEHAAQDGAPLTPALLYSGEEPETEYERGVAWLPAAEEVRVYLDLDLPILAAKLLAHADAAGLPAVPYYLPAEQVAALRGA